MAPFIIFGLPRSRTAWLARFLTYGGWVCGHEELRHMRSLGDVAAWLSQPCIGTVETAAAPWWRLLERFAPEARTVVIRRPVADVVASLMALPGCTFDRAALTASMTKLDHKLEQIAARVPNVLTVQFADLVTEATCAQVFEHCLPCPHDHAHWAALAPANVQCDMAAMMRYGAAFKAALDKLASIAKHETLAGMARRETPDPEGITFQTEPFEAWLRDAREIFDRHLIMVGEAPGDWQNKNIPLMQRLYDGGFMQIMTARSNGRMFGYLMTLIAPSLESETALSACNTTFFASPEFPGLGLKIQRAAMRELKARGVSEVAMQARTRGAGERVASIYRRLGAENDGQVYRLQLAGAA